MQPCGFGRRRPSAPTCPRPSLPPRASAQPANRAQVEVLRRAAEFSAPLLVLAAGADRIADATAARAFIDASRSTDKKLVVYDGFRHEIFNERERERPIAEAVGWLTAHAA